MHEGLDHLRSVVVVPDSAPGVCAKTNAGEDTLIGPTQVVTTINSVAHGFGPVKNVNWGITIQQELITEFRKVRERTSTINYVIIRPSLKVEFHMCRTLFLFSRLE